MDGALNQPISNGLFRALLRTLGCRTVLLVDDEEAVRRTANGMLKRLNLGLGVVLALPEAPMASVGSGSGDEQLPSDVYAHVALAQLYRLVYQ